MERSRSDEEDIIGGRPDEQSSERTTGTRPGRRDESREEGREESRRDRRRDEFDPTSKGDESGEVT
jgi:hypothetical protein